MVQSWVAILSLSLSDHFLTGPAMPRVTRRPRWRWAPTPLSSQTCNLGHVTAYGKKLSHMGQLLFNQANFEIFQASWQWIEFLFPCNFYFHWVWSCIMMKTKNMTMVKLNLCYKVDGKMCKQQLSWQGLPVGKINWFIQFGPKSQGPWPRDGCFCPWRAKLDQNLRFDHFSWLMSFPL